MAYGTVNADSITTSSGAILGAGNASAMKNRIINGAMVIDQRNAGGSINNTTTGTQYSVDRWAVYGDVANKFSVQQNAGSITPPAGFTKYLGVTSSSSYSVPSGEIYSIQQPIEGYNIADLGWGTANAKTVTLSFWVYSSLTGSFGGVLKNNASSRSYPFAYTISSSNTWTYITITVPGDTTGTWATDTTAGIRVNFSMGAGSTYQGTVNTWASAYYNTAAGTVNVVGTSGATWYVTGVQLEVGSSATGYEYRQYGQELALCQRYYYSRTYVVGGNSHMGIAQAYTGNNVAGAWIQVTNAFRATPTLTTYPSPSDINISTAGASGAAGTSSGSYTPQATNYGVYWDVARTGGGLSAGNASMISAINNCTFGFSAEL